MVTNSSGDVVEESDYYPFGQERPITDTLDNNYKFTGDERDTESGLDHTLYRQYASTQSRWLSPDPKRGNPTDPQSFNRYPYVRNSPTNFIDPDGREQVCTGPDDDRTCHWEDDDDLPRGGNSGGIPEREPPPGCFKVGSTNLKCGYPPECIINGHVDEECVCEVDPNCTLEPPEDSTEVIIQCQIDVNDPFGDPSRCAPLDPNAGRDKIMSLPPRTRTRIFSTTYRGCVVREWTELLDPDQVWTIGVILTVLTKYPYLGGPLSGLYIPNTILQIRDKCMTEVFGGDPNWPWPP
ncbi:MAG: RHS repeat-associated core domain-containing protein [Acidobacteria bacterium]|nr:RHS repeat-associated core domain-containing protein [Acidobacteriota bacterium]